MGFSYECSVVTHIGNRRKNNEDNFFIEDGQTLLPDEQQSMAQDGVKVLKKSTYLNGSVNRLYAVSDGMGGHKNGEIASRMVVQSLSAFTLRHHIKPCIRRREKYTFIQDFQEMIFQANEEILYQSGGDREPDGMGATLSGIVFFADECVVFNIGDSSTFLYEAGNIRKITRDDNEAAHFKETDVAVLKDKGKRLTKYFGMPRTCGTLTARISPPIPIRIGQIYVIASDGLTDYITQDELISAIESNMRDPTLVSTFLVNQVTSIESGGRDNVTVLIIKVHGEGERYHG